MLFVLVILTYVGLPFVFLFSMTAIKTITASSSAPTVTASAVTACTDRL